MSDFFSNYTKIDYNMNKVKPLSTTRAVNILNRPQKNLKTKKWQLATTD